MLSSIKKSQSDNKYISEDATLKSSLDDFLPQKKDINVFYSDKIIKNGYCFDCNTKIDKIYKRCYHCNLFYKNFYK